MASSKWRWLQRVAMGFVLVLIVSLLIGYWSGYGWTVVRVPGVRVAYRTGGSRGAVTLTVVDGDGVPVSGVAVASLSHSGWIQYEVTDAAGQAVIKPAEWEVLAVRVRGTEVWLCADDIIQLFLPDCDPGLEVQVVLDPAAERIGVAVD